MELSHSFDTITSRPPPPSPPGQTPETPCPPPCPTSGPPPPPSHCNTDCRMISRCHSDNQSKALSLSHTMKRRHTMGRSNTMGISNTTGRSNTMAKSYTMDRATSHAPSYCNHLTHAGVTHYGECDLCDHCGSVAFPDPPPWIPQPRSYTGARHRKPMEDEPKMSASSRCCFGLLALLAQILLHGVLALTLYWVIQYRWDGEGLPFAWRGTEKGDLEKQWNLHPVLMVTGFIYCMGQAMLVYRSCRCCRQIWSKLLHTMFHMLGIPCVVLGFIAVWDYHSLKKDNEGNSTPIPHFYSIHSWLGLVTMGLALLQFLVGVFSFLLLLCCQSATARCRAGLVPIHSTVGTTTFMLAVATAIAGITETAFFKLSSEGYDATGQPVITKLVGKYINMNEESIFLNTIGVILIALAIILPAILGCDGFRAGLAREGGSNN